mgnify:CR=1 FL=1
MPSTFLGLNTSYTGLVASNASLNTTANNIANIQTKGYSRQQVNQTAAEAMQFFATYGCVGAGVDILGAERVRDIFYDEKYWANSSKLGEMDKKWYYCNIIQEYMKDQKGTNEVKGFTSIFSEYQNTLSTLATATDQKNHALNFIGSAGKLCEYFRIMYNNFQKMQTDVNDEIKIKTDKINSLSQQIASLNKQINTIEVNGLAVANDLRDKRDLLIDELSSVVDVECKETEILDAQGRFTGLHDYSVKICGGQSLVSGYNYRQLECVPRATWQKVNQNDVDGLYDVRWTDTNEDLGVCAKNTGGELKGLFEIRDGNNYEAFTGKVTAVNTLDKSVTVRVTDEYLKSMSKSTLPLTDGRIMLGGEYYYYTDYDFRIDDDGECYYTFNLSQDKSKNPVAITKDLIKQSASVGQKVNYQGIPYYMEQMNEWVRDYAYNFNKIYDVEGATDCNEELTNGGIFYTGTDAHKGTQYALDVKIGAQEYNSAAQTGYFNITAGNFNVLKELEDDPSKMGTHTVETDGVAKYDIIHNLLDLASNKEKMTFRGCSAKEYLECLLGDSGLNAESALSFQNLYENIKESIANNRFSISGVDEDEEGANMIKFQNAYNLASKMISVLNECYDKLINATGV